MKTYEAMFLLDNREVKKGWDATREMVKSILVKHGAEVLVAKRWDERKLAYEIKRQKRATYLLSYFQCDAWRIDEIRRELTLTEPVLRHVVLQVEAIPPEAYEPEKEFGEVRIGEEEPQAKVAAVEAVPPAETVPAGEPVLAGEAPPETLASEIEGIGEKEQES